MIYTNEELYHYGAKGMKWGVRRWQNEDGTLTAAGKERYSSGSNGEPTLKYNKYNSDGSKKSKNQRAGEKSLYRQIDRAEKNASKERLRGNVLKEASYKDRAKNLYRMTKDREAVESYGAKKRVIRNTLVGTYLAGPLVGVGAGLVTSIKNTNKIAMADAHYDKYVNNGQSIIDRMMNAKDKYRK